MSGQGVLIIIIPNDGQNSLESAVKSTEITTDVESTHSAEFPCSVCSLSLASRFRHHISPKMNLADAIWILSEDRQQFFITCFAELGQHSDIILEELRYAEIGIRSGSKVFILPLSCALGIDNLTSAPTPKLIEIKGPSEESETTDDNAEDTEASQSDFKRSIRARLTVLQVVNAIRGQTVFSFDFLLLTILASFIALLGLLEDNSVILVASMLVSPLMGPILGIVFGLCIGDTTLWRVGLRTEALGLMVAICTGFFVGLGTTWSETKWGASTSFPTDEMRSRGDIRRLWSGALVALPSGAGAALSVLGGNVGSLVGVAISASLLPPAVNAGLLSSYSLLAALIPSIGEHSSSDDYPQRSDLRSSSAKNCTKFLDNDYLPIYSCHMARETALLSLCSFVLTMTNILCIIVVAMIILRVKQVMPIMRDDEIAEFWRDDVRIVRGQNQSKHSGDVPQLVELWKNSATSITKDPSKEESINENKMLLKHHNKADLILARKLRNLQEFAQAYHLDLSLDDDRCLRSKAARHNVQRMARDIMASIKEANQLNFDQFVAQLGRSHRQSRVQTFYQELLEVMPPKWKEIFEQEQSV